MNSTIPGLYSPDGHLTTEKNRKAQIVLNCFRCKRAAEPIDIDQGMYRPVVIDGVESDLCLPCVELILRKWVMEYSEVSRLKVS